MKAFFFGLDKAKLVGLYVYYFFFWGGLLNCFIEREEEDEEATFLRAESPPSSCERTDRAPEALESGAGVALRVMNQYFPCERESSSMHV